jgi:hypothetical protein
LRIIAIDTINAKVLAQSKTRSYDVVHNTFRAYRQHMLSLIESVPERLLTHQAAPLDRRRIESRPVETHPNR